MKLLVVGDLHYPYEFRFFQFKKLLERENPDLILICGDILNYFSLIHLDVFLNEIHKVSAAQLIAVMGNHDFWRVRKDDLATGTSWSNIYQYHRLLQEHGDILLWKNPYILDELGIVGVPGWFDFSFAPWSLGFTREDFERGVYNNSIWNDMLYTSFLMSSEEVTKLHITLLNRQLLDVTREDLNTVIVLLHFVPLKEFVPVQEKDKNELFWNAYYGSQQLGETILAYKDIISYVFFGHLSPRYLTQKKIIKEGIPFESVDITENINDSAILILPE